MAMLRSSQTVGYERRGGRGPGATLPCKAKPARPGKIIGTAGARLSLCPTRQGKGRGRRGLPHDYPVPASSIREPDPRTGRGGVAGQLHCRSSDQFTRIAYLILEHGVHVPPALSLTWGRSRGGAVAWYKPFKQRCRVRNHGQRGCREQHSQHDHNGQAQAGTISVHPPIIGQPGSYAAEKVQDARLQKPTVARDTR